MQLLYFVMLIGSVFGRTLANAWPHLDPAKGFLATTCLILMSGAIVRVLMVHAAVLLDETGSRGGAQSAARIYRASMNWGWAFGSPWILAGFGWGATENIWLGDHGSWTLAIVFWFAPSMLFLLLADHAWYEWEYYLRGKIPSRNLEHRSLRTADYSSFLNAFWNHAKHTWLLVLLPTLGVCGIMDATGLSMELPLENGAWWVVGIIAFVVVMVVLPELIARMWNVRPVENDELRAGLARIWKLASGVDSSIVTWNTDHRVANAMVLGFTPLRRWLLLSDLLLARCSQSQLEVIALHEVAHIRRWHLALRASPIFIGFAITIVARWIVTLPTFAPYQLLSSAWVVSAFAGLKILFVFALLSKVARWTELDADRHAVELSQVVGISNEHGQRLNSHQVAGLLATTLKSMMVGVPMQRRTWLHPSLAERCQALQSLFPDSTEGSQQLSQSEEASSLQVASAT